MHTSTAELVGASGRRVRLGFPSLARVRLPINAVMRTSLVGSLASPRAIDDYLALFDPAWSIRHVRARVVRIEREVSDATSLYLLPNENWRGFRAGQFVQLSATVAGVRHTRCFSLSSAPEDGRHLRVTIKAVPGGRVSGWAHGGARVGDLVELSQAMGEFVLPDPLPAKLLFVSGGSGITPVLSMLRHLAAVGYAGAASCLHYARHEVIAGEELSFLARRLRARLAVVRTGASAGRDAVRSRLSPGALEELDPAWTESEAFVCGPRTLSEAVASIWQSHGASARLRMEHFGPAPAAPVPSAGGASCRIVFARSRRETRGGSGLTLLDRAEAAGLRPPSGCRMGICHSCTCRKVAGTVRNELTGVLSSQEDEPIQLCISAPVSDVTLDL